MPFPNEHFPLFTHGILRAQSECPASRQTGSYVGGPVGGGGGMYQKILHVDPPILSTN